MEYRWNYLLSQRNQLCSVGTGVPLLVGAGSGEGSEKAALRDGSVYLSGFASGISHGLRYECIVSDTDYLLGERLYEAN